MKKQVCLSVRNLSVKFKTLDGVETIIEDNSFDVYKGEVLGLVGESGCGKSLTALSIMGLVEKPVISKTKKMIFEGEDISQYSEKKMRNIRGNKISMIFQEPLTSLNPLFTIGNQMDEVFKLHRKLNKKESRLHSIQMLNFVGISGPEGVYERYPKTLSGGMRQRVMIAMALSCQPQLLIADEPTTALDVTIQRQILNLMQDLQKEMNTSIILITHDLSVIAEMADRVIVMYAGEIVEQADIFSLFEDALHPYTKGLLRNTIKLGEKINRLPTISGTVPSISNMPTGCKFHPRCEFAIEKCIKEKPKLVQLDDGRMVRCNLFYGERENEDNKK